MLGTLEKGASVQLAHSRPVSGVSMIELMLTGTGPLNRVAILAWSKLGRRAGY